MSWRGWHTAVGEAVVNVKVLGLLFSGSGCSIWTTDTQVAGDLSVNHWLAGGRLICCICPFLWCKYTHGGWFQAINKNQKAMQDSWKFMQNRNSDSKLPENLSIGSWPMYGLLPTMGNRVAPSLTCLRAILTHSWREASDLGWQQNMAESELWNFTSHDTDKTIVEKAGTGITWNYF